MKKYIALILCAVLIVFCSACEDSGSSRRSRRSKQSDEPGISSRMLTEKTDPYKDQVYGSSFGRVYIYHAIEFYTEEGDVWFYEISVGSEEAYDGSLTVIVDILPDGTVRNVFYFELHETPGKGMLCGESAFLDQFSGKNVSAFVLGSNVDAVSGATITSKATVNAVNAALDFFHHVIMEG